MSLVFKSYPKLGQVTQKQAYCTRGQVFCRPDDLPITQLTLNWYHIELLLQPL